MIYTLTLNPSLDLYLTLNSLTPGRIHRADRETIVPGGKGVNVALVLSRLGVPARALGFTSGRTGRLLAGALADEGLDSDFLFLANGMTRVNVKLRASAETDVNGPGPLITADDLERLKAQLNGLLTPGDTLVLSGSVPPGVPADFYGQLITLAHEKGAFAALDASGAPLRAAPPFHPDLIKPNEDELAALVGRPLPSREAVLGAAYEAQTMGAGAVLVSLGAEGALLVRQDALFQSAPAGTVVGTVGAGDSMLAGWLAAQSQGADDRAALKLAVAAGAMTAFTDWLANADEIEALARALP